MLISTKGLTAAKLIGTKLIASKLAVGVGTSTILFATGVAVAPYEVSYTTVDDTGTVLTAIHEPIVVSDATKLSEEPAVPIQPQIIENRDYEKYITDGHLQTF